MSTPMLAPERSIDFQRDVARAPLSIALPPEATPSDLAVAAEAWRDRMVSETVSSRVFCTLVPQLLAAGAHTELVAEVTDMAREEIEHGRLCARVAAALGGTPFARIERPLPEVPRHPDAAPLEALLRNVLHIGCMSETVAVALLSAERGTLEPSLVPIETRILSDEVGHARLGWRLLAGIDWTADLRTRIDRYLPVAFEAHLRHHAGFAHGPSLTRAARRLGAPDRRLGEEVFLETTEEVIVPGLARHGLASADAWRQALAALPRAA